MSGRLPWWVRCMWRRLGAKTLPLAAALFSLVSLAYHGWHIGVNTADQGSEPHAGHRRKLISATVSAEISEEAADDGDDAIDLPMDPNVMRASSAAVALAPSKKSPRLSDFTMRERRAETKPSRSEPSSTTAQQRGHGIIYFLFLLDHDLPHQRIWRRFFAKAGFAGSHPPRLFAHCQRIELCRRSSALKELSVQLVDTVPSTWCADLVSPMWRLVKSALDELSDLTDAGGDLIRKFVFVSDSSLPLKSYPKMRSALLETDQSDLCISPQPEWDSGAVRRANGGKVSEVSVSVVKHHQWAILNLADARAFAAGWDRLGLRGRSGQAQVSTGNPLRWDVPRMGPNGRADLDDAIPRGDIGAFRGRCPDEEAFTSMIFGLFEPDLRAKWSSVLSRSTCRTYVDWSSGKLATFKKLTPAIKAMCRNASESSLFARKFDKDLPDQDVLALIAML